VNKTKAPILITRFGVPVAELIPAKTRKKKGDWLGCMKGTARITGDIVGPIIDLSDIEACGTERASMVVQSRLRHLLVPVW
jgi:antitoxin (DNA-binding transcriptional repressor) of toxin-antitoxin stability system